MTKRTIERLGYSVKHTEAVGWWVDGACGYLVSGYWQTATEAVNKAAAEIAEARRAGVHPAWLVN
jgi:hypothetical protein